jgi:hypothetical protein
MATKPSGPIKPTTAASKEQVQPRSFLRDDVPVIRKAAIMFAICLLLGAALVGVSQYFLAKQKAVQLQAQAELAEAQGQYTAATNEKNEIRDFQPKYIELVRRNFIGEEKRIDVIEHIHAIQQKRKFLPITYEILPQQVVQLDPSMSTGELELRGSTLVLHMGLLHELDMLTFLNDLRTAGSFVPQSCSMKQIDTSREFSLSARLEAECSLIWVSMGRRATAETESAVPAQ